MRRLPAAVVLVTVLAGLAGCGGPSSESWAADVCGTLAPWRVRIAELNAEAQRQLSAARDPAQARESLLDLLTGAEQASETARAAVSAAGAPDVAGGDDVARRFVESLERVRDAYAHARSELQKLSPDDADTFYSGVVAVLGRLNAEYARSAVDTTALDAPELRAAFDGVAACR